MIAEDAFLEAAYEDRVADLVMADTWEAETFDFPGELYDTDDYDGWDEEDFG